LTRYHLYLLVGLVLVIVGPAAFTQPGPGGRGGGGGRGRGMMDPNAMFNMYSGGKDEIVVSEVQVPEFMQRWVTADDLKERMNNFLKSKGVTDGRMTRELFTQYSEEQRREMMARFQGMRGGGGGGRRGGGAAPSGDSPSSPGSGSADSPSDRTRPGGGDRDGERTERRRDRGQGGSDQGGAQPEQSPPEEKRPVVYRIGKLPKELPAWFSQADADRDAQVGLYEWKQAGRNVDEFLKMDLNGDGFVTVEEVLRYQKAQAKLARSTGNGPPSTPTPGNGGAGPGGGNPFGGGRPDFSGSRRMGPR
jgi:hypothetical protein